MRTLNRNKQAVYYALYLGESEYIDGNGNKTGQYTANYAAPVKVWMNVSAARGTADLEQFGINTRYTHTLVTDDTACPIAKDTILWIGKTPDANGESGAVKHNFAVRGIAKSINSITVAVEEVEVT